MSNYINRQKAFINNVGKMPTQIETLEKSLISSGVVARRNKLILNVAYATLKDCNEAGLRNTKTCFKAIKTIVRLDGRNIREL